MSLFDVGSILLVLAALFAWLNYRSLGLPGSIGLLAMGLTASLALVGLEVAIPSQHLTRDVTVRRCCYARIPVSGPMPSDNSVS